MKKVYIIWLLLLCGGVALGQSNGDYRSAATGNWHAVATWQVYNNNAWVPLNNAAAGPYQNVIPTSSSGNITVSHNVTITQTVNLNQIVVDGSAQLRINAGVIVRLVEDGTVPLEVGSTASVYVLGTLDLQSLLTSTACHIFGTFISSGVVTNSNASLLVFHDGATYQHTHSKNGNIPIATWAENSNCSITGLASPNPTPPGNLDQSFGNFIWDTPNLGSSQSFSLGGKLTTVNGSLILKRTSTRTVRFSSLLPGYNLTIGKDLIIQSGGRYWFTANQSSASSITIGGDLIMSSGTVVLGTYNNSNLDIWLSGNFQKSGGSLTRGQGNGIATIHFDGGGPVQTYTNNETLTLNSPVHFAVEPGSTLDLGNSFLSGNGSFTLKTNATLNVGSSHTGGAIQNGTSAGNIRLAGARTYQPGSTISYNGTANQFIAAGHPSVPNVRIDNTVGVTLNSNVTINGDLILGDNNLIVDDNTLTLGGTLIRGESGAIGVSSSSSLTINGSGTFGDLVLYFTEEADNPIRNLTINRSGTVYLGSPLKVGGNFTQTAGNLSLGEFTNYTLELRGNVYQTGGTVSIYGGAGIVIAGTGVLPGEFNMTGAGLNTLTMNRAGRVFKTNAYFTLMTLNLFAGRVDNSDFNITMGDNGVVTRTSGLLSGVLGAQTSYDVIYDVSGDIVTGGELPFTSPVTTRLGNLTKRGTGSVTLNHPIVVNKSFVVEDGTFDIFHSNDVAIFEDLTVTGTLLCGESKVSFTGTDQMIDLANSVTLFDVEINQSSPGRVELNGSGVLDIQNSLAILTGSEFVVGEERLRLLSTKTRTANILPLHSNAEIDGSVVVQRFLPYAHASANYRYMSSPVANSTFEDWDAELPISKAFRFNETKGDYDRVSLKSNLLVGVGYSVGVTSTFERVYDTRGVINRGNISIPLTSQSSEFDSPEGFNLIGNPYPSAISWTNVDLPNDGSVFNAVYITDNFNNSGQGTGVHSVYYVDGTSVPEGFNGNIAQGQAFWVKAASNTTLTLTEAAKVPNTDLQFYRQATPENVLRIVLEGHGDRDEAVVRLREGASNNFDPKYDAERFFASSFGLATLTQDKIKAVINSTELSGCQQVIPITSNFSKSGQYHLSFSGIDSFDGRITILLNDNLTGHAIDLRANNKYSFTITDKDLSDSSRFSVTIGDIALNTHLISSGDIVCEDSDMALVTIQKPEQNVIYSAYFNGEKVSDEFSSENGPVVLEVDASRFNRGHNEIVVLAKRGSCSMELAVRPVVEVNTKPVITSVQPVEICTSGTATLRAAANPDAVMYHWYDAEDASAPISTAAVPEFTTGTLNKSRTFYVSALNSSGCEGARVPVKVTVSQQPDVDYWLTFDQSTNMLITNIDGDSRWYKDGQLISDETAGNLAVEEPGVYTVEAGAGACIVQRQINVSPDDLFEGQTVTVFPNPVVQKAIAKIRSSNKELIFKLFNSKGVQLSEFSVRGSEEVKTSEIDLIEYAPGIYYLHILDGGKRYTHKLVKSE